MSIDFATLQGLSIPEGVVTKIEDAAGRVLWELVTSKPVVLEVEKIVSNTYAGETTYENEEFILLDIYPKSGGTVNVTYGGLAKTITDTSGAAEPNAQQVFFGTFNGVSDSVETPASGTLTINGDYYAFGLGAYARDSSSYKSSINCSCITAIKDVGDTVHIPVNAFMNHPHGISTYKKALKRIILKNGVESIGNGAFSGCDGIEEMYIPSSVSNIYRDIFFEPYVGAIRGRNVILDDAHPTYRIVSGCVIRKDNPDKVDFGFVDAEIPQGVKTIGTKAFDSLPMEKSDFVIPNGVQTIEEYAFHSSTGITTITIPASVTNVGQGAFYGINSLKTVTFLGTTPPTAPDTSSTTYVFSDTYIEKIIVPPGCGAAYKSAPQWKRYEKYITEAL